MVHHLQKTFKPENKPVIFLYLDEQDSTNHTLQNLFGSLLEQLIQRKLSFSMLEELQSLSKSNGTDIWLDIFKLLQKEILTYDRVYIIVDALNECVPSSRDEFELQLRNLQRRLPDKISLMIAGRDSKQEDSIISCDNCKAPELSIFFRCRTCNNGNFDLCQKCKNQGLGCYDESHVLVEPYLDVPIRMHTKDEDIEQYIRLKVEGKNQDDDVELRDERVFPNHSGTTVLGQNCRENPGLLDEIIVVAVENVEGNLLLARLYIEQLEHAADLKEIITVMNRFPEEPGTRYKAGKELDQKYEAAMLRMQRHEHPRDRALAMEILSHIVSARRSLTLAELEDLLTRDPQDTDMDKDNRYVGKRILSVTKPLTVISEYDENAIVRVFHFSLNAYLNKTRDRWFPNVKVDMAKACLTYLNFGAFSNLCQDVEEFQLRKRSYPFIAYASQYWGDHVRDAGLDPEIQEMTMRFFDQPFRIAASIQAAWFSNSWGFDTWGNFSAGVYDLHVCAWFGLSWVISALEGNGKNLQLDFCDMTRGETPLMYACRRGHIEVVRQLLDRHAAINVVSKRKYTAMFEAVEQNQREIVELLLNKGKLNFNAVCSSRNDRTALMLAASQGRSDIVRSLLTYPEVERNARDKHGYTALCLAANAQSIPTVQSLLMDTVIDVDAVNDVGYSALFIAAIRNNCAIVKLLLQKPADLSLRDKQGQGTAILRAIDCGCIDVVELMMEDGQVDIKCLDSDGRCLIHSASTNGYPEIICSLYEYGLDLDVQDKNGMTGLHDASRRGHLRVVQTLLRLEADATKEDLDGRTPLDIAVLNRKMEIASILKAKSIDQQVSPSLVMDAETSPVWVLIKSGRLDLVAQAIAARKSGLSEKEPITNNTALHWAALENKADIMQMLLEDSGLSPNPVDRYRRTPLHLAAINGYLEVTRVLLDHHAEVNVGDQWGDTPLSLAHCETSQAANNFPIAIALIEAGANTECINVQDMFFAAVKLGHIAAVQILLGKGAEPLAQDVAGQRAIELAEQAGNAQMVRILQSSPRV